MTRSVRRVLRPGGCYHFYYPNRFSLLHETHTSLWGVGFLPRRLQLWWVRRARGVSFEGTRLYSAVAMRRLVARHFQRSQGHNWINLPEILQPEKSIYLKAL